MKRILWISQLILFSWGFSFAQFTPIVLPLENGPLSDRYLGLDDGSTPLFWLRAWDYGQGKIYPPSNIQSLGGPVPDSAMIAYMDTASGRIPGHSYIASQMGIPFWKASTDSTYFVYPGETDTFPIASGANGFVRLHHSLMYIYGTQNFSSAKYRAISDTSQGRTARVRSQLNGSHAGNIGDIVDPYLQPASNIGRDFGDGNPLPGTTLQGDAIPSVRWTLFSMMFVEDDETIPFHWPGFHTGDYSNTGTDGPHFAFNVWQVKGRFSGTVPLSLKWRGQQLITVIQDPTGNLVGNPILLGPNAVSGFTDSLSSYANKWLDFLVRTKPGFSSRGDNPGVSIYFKESDAQTWNLLYEYQGDFLSEIESNALTLQNQYGMPANYLGLSNGGIYPSVRLSSHLLRNYWTPFRLSLPDRAYMKIRHSEYLFAEYAEGMEPSPTAIFSLANAAMPPLSGGTSGPFPVEYLSFNAIPKGNTVELNWITASESNNQYFLVQHSQDGEEWKSISKVQGAGTTVQSVPYQYVDLNPSTGQNYYRLQQVDIEGSSSFSSIRQVRLEEVDIPVCSVYPNPLTAGAELTLQVSASQISHDLTISIMDSRGAHVFSQLIPLETVLQHNGLIRLSPLAGCRSIRTAGTAWNGTTLSKTLS